MVKSNKDSQVRQNDTKANPIETNINISTKTEVAHCPHMNA